jgi:hypothetical protein
MGRNQYFFSINYLFGFSSVRKIFFQLFILTSTPINAVQWFRGLTSIQASWTLRGEDQASTQGKGALPIVFYR